MNNAQGRAMRPQSRGTAWVRRAITLAVLAAGVWSVTASRAEAGTAPIVRQFMCPLPFVGTQAITISVVPPALDTVNVGVPSPRLRLTATGTVTSAARLVVSFLGAEWAEGTGVLEGEVATPQGTFKESMPFTVPRTDVATGSGPLSVSGFGTLPSMTFSRPGDGEIFASGLTFRLSLLNSAGGQTWLSPFNITCTLASGQSDAVASFRILPAGASTASPNPISSTVTRPPSPRPTPRPTPSTVTSSPAPPPSPAPTPPPKPSSPVPSPLWPVGIAVVVGGLGWGAWWLLRHWLA
jgi:hypothetical protein